MKIWLQRGLALLIGVALGFFLRPSQSGRFVWDKDGTYALDTKTGQMCIPVQPKENGTNLPICLDIYKHY